MPAGPFTTMEDSILRLDLRSRGWSWACIAKMWPRLLVHELLPVRSPTALRKRASRVLLRSTDAVLKKLDMSSLQFWGDAADEQHAMDEDAVQPGHLASGDEEVDCSSDLSFDDDNSAGGTCSMECGVCLQTMLRESGTTIQLPCAHDFCVTCVAKWWRQTDLVASDNSEAPQGFKCPLCRSSVPRVWLHINVGGFAPSLERLGRAAAHLCSLSEVTYQSTFGEASELSLSDLAQCGIGCFSAWPQLGDMVTNPVTKEVLRELGLGSASACLYVQHLQRRTPLGLRLLVLLCATARGLALMQQLRRRHDAPWLPQRATQAALRKARELMDVLQDTRLLTTMPLWLAADGTESVPEWIGHETMLKPDDMCTVAEGPSAQVQHVFLSAPEITQVLTGATDEQQARSDNPGAFRHLEHTPIWSIVATDLHDQLVATEEPGARAADEEDWQALSIQANKRLALLLYYVICCCNASNPRSCEALGCNADVCQRLHGRFVNYHQPAWLTSVANRLRLSTTDGLATTDSIWLVIPGWNFDELKDSGHRAAAYFLHLFAPLNRLLLRHVRHLSTAVHCDKASEVMLMLFAYEAGWLQQLPLLDDIVAMISSNEKHQGSILVPHPMCTQPFVFWGYGRSGASQGSKPFRGQGSQADSDTHGRLNAAVWLSVMKWGGVATGGMMPPGVSGGSAQGKSPTPNDYQGEDACEVYRVRRRVAEACVGDPAVQRAHESDGTLRPIFPHWVQVTRLQACDFAAVIALVYRFAKPAAIDLRAQRCAVSRRMLWHVCGGEQHVMPAWPCDVGSEHSSWLSLVPGARKHYMSAPPAHLWTKTRMKFPVLVTDAMELLRWWDAARVPAKAYKHRPGD